MPNKHKGQVTEFDRKIGERIRLARTEKGLSQEKLAKHLGLTFQQVQKYERGTNRVSAGRLKDIAEFLDRPVAYFIGSDRAESPDADLLTRMLLTGRRGIDMAEHFLSLPTAMQAKVADIVADIAAAHAEAGAVRREAA